MNELVKHLTSGEHPVVVGGSRPSLDDLQRRATDMGYVFVKFTDTKGGTDLGVRVDRDASDVSQANWQEGTGTIHVEGNLTLDYVPVRCVADIDLATLSGTGHLVAREEATA
jgi:hypothetical protein